MKELIYIPPSCRAAETHLGLAFKKGIPSLTKKEFVRCWCSLSFLRPDLHPDDFASRDGGWPEHFKPFASEAWRRFEAGLLTDNELYCYQAAKARIGKERYEAMRTLHCLVADGFST
ncbi:MAG TPA: hypothetical protein PKE12_09815 [Kiritimatiellia bacterium]|nr:hypothetical protein [Kiritimatiellia bacterium]